jgi:hypothetical protein
MRRAGLYLWTFYYLGHPGQVNQLGIASMVVPNWNTVKTEHEVEDWF